MKKSEYQRLLAKLPKKRRRFTQEFLIDLNAKQAAIRAGYSKKTAHVQGSVLLAYPSVDAAVNAGLAEISEKLEISREYVLTSLKNVADRCMSAVPVTKRDKKTGELVETGVYKFDSAGANKALENLGRHIGVFERDNKQRRSNVVEMSTEELAKIAKKGQ